MYNYDNRSNKIEMKQKKKYNKFIILILIFLEIALFWNTKKDKESYALYEFGENTLLSENYSLNPDWIEYIILSEEEQSKYDIIPEKYILKYTPNVTKNSFFDYGTSYPEYYNLVTEGYTTSPDDQGNLGLCWAFATLNSVESNMLINGLSTLNNPITFSERQLDYAAINPNYIKEKFNPYYERGRDVLGDGAYSDTAYGLFGAGISPVSTEIFGEYNEQTDIKSLNEVFNVDNVEYVVDSYVNIGAITDSTSDDDRQSWVNDVKNHILNHGAVSISSIGPRPSYAGSCIYTDYENQNYMLNVSGECNPTITQNGHALSIIGWDDNYSYKYCRNNNSTTSDLTNCTNIVSGKGAFILKNSWGEVIPYPYLSYKSNVDGSYGVISVSKKNWNVNYDISKSYTNEYETSESIITYDKSDEIVEKLKKISFVSNYKKNIEYTIYLNDGVTDEFVKIDTINTSYIGMYSIEVNDLLLTKDNFTIKIVSDNGYATDIFAYTEYSEESEQVIVDTKLKENNFNSINFELFLSTTTRNIPTGESIEYKFFDSNDNDISNLISVTNNVVLNNVVLPNFNTEGVIPGGTIKVQVIYDNVVYDDISINVEELENFWSGGEGTIKNPFLITNLDEFLKIYTNEEYMKLNYKIIKDIDFSSISNWKTSDYVNDMIFTGSIDGNNHVLYGLNSTGESSSLFGDIENATIKNLIISDFDIEIENEGYATLLGKTATNSIFENIVIAKDVKIDGKAFYAGGIVGTAYDCIITKVANYGEVNTMYNSAGMAAGIVGEAYGTEINEVYNHGNITATKSFTGGIAGTLGLSTKTTNYGKIQNAYNYGNINSNYFAGGIVGFGYYSIIDSCYNIFSVVPSGELVANIAGASIEMFFLDCYYLSGTGYGIIYDENNNSILVNFMPKTSDQLKQKASYISFDFSNIWTINNDYPYFKFFNYIHTDKIDVPDTIELKVGQISNINVGFNPSNSSVKKAIYKGFDHDVIEVDENGNIYALSEGETKINVYTIDGSNLEKEITVKVELVELNLEDYKIIDDKYLKLNVPLLKDDLIKSIDNTNFYDIKISGENEFISTGDEISIYSKDGMLVNKYGIFVLGDVTGTGTINVSDVAKLYQYIRNSNIEMEEVYKKAADVENDGTLKINDVSKLYQYIRNVIESLEE